LPHEKLTIYSAKEPILAPACVDVSRHLDTAVGSPGHLFGMTRQNPIEHLQPLISLQELAEYLGVPVQRIYDWRAAGTGPRGYRFGRELRFRVADVERWLEEQAESSDGR